MEEDENEATRHEHHLEEIKKYHNLKLLEIHFNENMNPQAILILIN